MTAANNCPEIWPGPMEGVFTPHFIRTASRMKLVSRWLTPFLQISHNLPTRRKMREFTAVYRECGLPFTIQLLGSDMALLGEAATILHQDGITQINLNCGCPSNRVIKHSGGGGWLREPDHLQNGLTAFCRNFPHAFSIKLRAGFTSPEEMRQFLPELRQIPTLEKIFFHYRTVAELYQPIADDERRRRFLLAAELLEPVPLILNGDIGSVEEGRTLLNETGAAGIMIARPWLRDPYLLRRFQRQEAGAETARTEFFTHMNDGNLTEGAGMELRKLLWGEKSPQFLEACRRRTAEKTPRAEK